MVTQEPQRDLKPTLIPDVAPAVVGLLLVVQAKGLLQKGIRVDGITAGPQRAVDCLTLDNAENQYRVRTLPLQEEVRCLGDAVAVLAADKAHVGENKVV